MASLVIPNQGHPSETRSRRGVEFSLLPAREADLPDILAMIRELAAFENLEAELEVTALSLREALFGAHPVAAALVASIDNNPAGYAIYYRSFSSFVGRSGLFLDDLYVRPAFRHRRVGRALLEQLAEIGLEQRCGRLEWIALRWNENALRFYQHIGARSLEEWVMLRLDPDGMKLLVEGNRR